MIVMKLIDMPSPVCYTLSSHSLLVLMGDQMVLYCAYILTPIPFSPSHYLPQLNIIYPSPYCVPCPLRLLILPPFCAFLTSPWRHHHLIPPYSYVLYFHLRRSYFRRSWKREKKVLSPLYLLPPPPSHYRSVLWDGLRFTSLSEFVFSVIDCFTLPRLCQIQILCTLLVFMNASASNQSAFDIMPK
jgi:hypothetical protein